MSENWLIEDFAAALDQFEAAMQVVPTNDLIRQEGIFVLPFVPSCLTERS